MSASPNCVHDSTSAITLCTINLSPSRIRSEFSQRHPTPKLASVLIFQVIKTWISELVRKVVIELGSVASYATFQNQESAVLKSHK